MRGIFVLCVRRTALPGRIGICNAPGLCYNHRHMSKSWLRAKEPEFVRDMVRDFCLVSRHLEREFKNYEQRGYVDFETLRYLIGEEMNKGLLWRLKDTAHHLFKNLANVPRVGEFLDWGLGYIFHDAMKLKEDAYEQQNYAPWFRELADLEWNPEVRAVADDLGLVLGQTKESIEREITRIRYILYNSRRLLPLYLARHRDNELLARFFFAQRDLVREIFGERYDDLVQTVYGDNPEHMYLLAAMSLRKGGWMEESGRAIAEAERINPEHPSVVREKQIIQDRLG